ncbi:hypothetical protein [uncultured Corynebacterium sp.]|uniref:hypothetical protein n=1 Tax=uncultured Corynebacterium sp. TaxID=159447 RepID=UPI0025D0FAE3|nr:hypothetical protein [uncultured Corynebacterium sp.]
MFSNECGDLGSGGTLGNDVDVRFGTQQSGESAPDQGLIFGDEYADVFAHNYRTC